MTNSYYQQQGQLVNHWYPLIENRKLGKKPARKIVLGKPVLLVRNKAGEVKAFVDRCPHRGAQLSQGHCDGETIACPYHGWRFALDGHCVDIPSQGKTQSNIRLQNIPIAEHLGLLWCWLGEGAPDRPIPIQPTLDDGWRLVHLQHRYNANVEDLIENFMDSPHTVFVHTGLIRGVSKLKPRTIEVQANHDEVVVTHPPQREKLGFFDWFINPQHELVTHSDKFILPSHVEVQYAFGNAGGKFLGILAMNPISPTQTDVFVVLGLRFGWLTPLLSFVIRPLARRVLNQDDRILSQQAENLKLDPNAPKKSISSDLPDMCVRRLRAWVANPTLPPPPSSLKKNITIHL